MRGLFGRGQRIIELKQLRTFYLLVKTIIIVLSLLFQFQIFPAKFVKSSKEDFINSK